MFANFESNFFLQIFFACCAAGFSFIFPFFYKKKGKNKAKNKKQAAVAALLPCFKLVLSLLACLLANFLSLQIIYVFFSFFNLHSLYFF